LNNLVIVAVDENTVILKVLNDFLTQLGHQVYSYPGFEDLKSKHPSTKPADIIFICPDLSDQHTREVITQTHKLHPRADIVIIRNSHGLLSFNDAMANRVFAYLSKPFKLGEVELMVTRIGEKRQYMN